MITITFPSTEKIDLKSLSCVSAMTSEGVYAAAKCRRGGGREYSRTKDVWIKDSGMRKRCRIGMQIHDALIMAGLTVGYRAVQTCRGPTIQRRT